MNKVETIKVDEYFIGVSVEEEDATEKALEEQAYNLFQDEKYEASFVKYEELNTLDPNNSMYIENIIDCLFYLKDHSTLVNKLKTFIRNPHGGNAFKCFLYTRLSASYGALGNTRQCRYHALNAEKFYFCLDEKYRSAVRSIQVASALGHAGFVEKEKLILETTNDRFNDVFIKRLLSYAYVEQKEYDNALDLMDTVPVSQIPDFDFLYRSVCKKNNSPDRLLGHLGRMQQYYHGEIFEENQNNKDAKYTSPEISVDSIIVDLKQQEGGAIKILELGLLPAAGLMGYNAIHGDGAMERLVDAGYAITSACLTYGDSKYKPDDLSLKYKFTGADNADIFSSHIYQVQRNSPIHFNASMNTWTASEYKDDFALNVQRSGLSSFIPETVIASRYEDQKNIMMRADCLQSDHLILKTSKDSQGRGVEIIPRNRLKKVIDGIVNHRGWHGCKSPEIWESDFHPNFLIQETVASEPCEAKNGEMYDGTMRVVLTNMFNHSNGENEVMFHGMYWKLPDQPLDTKRGKRSSLVSMSPFKAKKDQSFSAEVAVDRQNQVASQLRGFFNVFGEHLAKNNIEVIEEKLKLSQSAEETHEVYLAQEHLTSHPYGNIIQLSLFKGLVKSDFISSIYSPLVSKTHHGQKILNVFQGSANELNSRDTKMKYARTNRLQLLL